MKAILRWMLVIGTGLTTAGATVVSTGLVRQPLNPGPGAEAHRIPIGWAPCESNHGYGTLELISAPFPMIHGGWRWEGGLELNGNLPSAFGISVEPEDSTNVPGSPVMIRVRKQAPPGYSPFSKEQVLLATLRCLLDSVAATEKLPLSIEVLTEDPEDEPLKRFSGTYVTRGESEDGEFEPTPLPGCQVETGPRGLEWLSFGDQEEAEEARVLWIPFAIEGDSDGGQLLVPMGLGSETKQDELVLVGSSWPVLKDLFNPIAGGPEANSLARQGSFSTVKAWREEQGTMLYAATAWEADPANVGQVAAFCWAAVLTDRPTEDRPLQISLRLNSENEALFKPWIEEAGWEKVSMGSHSGIECTFVWDRGKQVLSKGAIPGGELKPGRGGCWGLVGDE